MKHKLIVAALAALFSGAAFAAGEIERSGDQGGYESQTGAGGQMDEGTGAAAQDQGRAGGEGETVPSVGGEAPVTEHQAEGTKEVTTRFEKLDKDGDDKISREEAQSMPELADYWDKQGFGEGDTMDQADFAQFESRMETGIDIYDSERKGPGDMPGTQHQREVTGEGESGAGESGGTESPGAE